MTNPDAALTMTTERWTFPVVIMAVIFILFLVHQKWWGRFAIKRKWAARFSLFVLTACLVIFLQPIAGWAFAFVPAQFTFESPDLVATAIKLGLYRVYVEQEEKRLLPEKEALLLCVNAVSQDEFEKIKKDCNADAACIEAAHPMSREDIIAKIKESQARKIEKISDACKDIEASKL